MIRVKICENLLTIITCCFILPLGISAARKPFKIYWNAPSANCGFLNLTKKYGITANTNERFKPGDQIVIFYDHEFGRIPYYNASNNAFVFGGIPQFGRWEDHVHQLEEDV